MWIALLASCRYEKRFKINEIREFRSYSTFYCFILVLWHLRAERDMSFCVSSPFPSSSHSPNLTLWHACSISYRMCIFSALKATLMRPDMEDESWMLWNKQQNRMKTSEFHPMLGKKIFVLIKSSQSFSYILVHTSNSYGKMFSLAWAEYIQSLPSMRAIQTISLHKKSKEKK